VMGTASADIVRFEVDVREVEGSESEARGLADPEMEMEVGMIWQEDGGVLSWMTEDSASEERFGGGRWGVSRAVDRAAGWVRRVRSRSRVA